MAECQNMGLHRWSEGMELCSFKNWFNGSIVQNKQHLQRFSKQSSLEIRKPPYSTSWRDVRTKKCLAYLGLGSHGAVSRL